MQQVHQGQHTPTLLNNSRCHACCVAHDVVSCESVTLLSVMYKISCWVCCLLMLLMTEAATAGKLSFSRPGLPRTSMIDALGSWMQLLRLWAYFMHAVCCSFDSRERVHGRRDRIKQHHY